MKWEIESTPFLEDRHILLSDKVSAWNTANKDALHPLPGPGYWQSCKKILALLAEAGFLEYILPQPSCGDEVKIDLRAICVIREGLTFESNLAATLFSVQGMGLLPVARIGNQQQKDAYLNSARQGETVCAIAISEPAAGSDVGGIATTAIPNEAGYRINGIKTWIANGAIADHFLVLAKMPNVSNQQTIAAFLIDRDTPGIAIHPDIPMGDDCPLSMISFENVQVDKTQRIGSDRDGLRAVMSGFSIFRPTVGASAVGIAKRALAEAIAWVEGREIYGAPMAMLESVQSHLAEMAADTETASLSVYRAAWHGDVVGGDFSREAAISKLIATEAAQRVVDKAVQICGAMGVCKNSVVERLYREVRPMRIYEGASEVQKMIIARSLVNTRQKS